MDTEITAQLAAAAMVTNIVERKKRSRMMASLLHLAGWYGERRRPHAQSIKTRTCLPAIWFFPLDMNGEILPKEVGHSMSDIDLFGDGQGAVHLDSEIDNGTQTRAGLRARHVNQRNG